MKKIMIFAAATLLISSCGVYNKYERPDVETKGLVRDAVSDIDTLVVQDTASFGNLPWRAVFTDPQLQALIEQGLERNPDLLNAALNVKMYESMLTAAKLAFLPAVNIGQQSPMGTISTLYTDPSVTTSIVDAGPLRQHPVAETQHTDEAAGHEGLPDGRARTDHRRYRQQLLHAADARRTAAHRDGNEQNGQGNVGHDGIAASAGPRALYQCAEC